jgi:hypothetical protein
VSSATAFQTNFSAGEISPRLYGRVDVAKYANGCQKLENFIVQRFGGAKKRGGTEFINEVKTSATDVRLIPFIYSVTQAYVLEFGDSYIRFYTNGGRVESPPGTPVEVASPWDELEIWDLQFAQSADVLYITHPNFAPRTLSRTSATTFVLDVMEFQDGPYLELNTTDTTLTPASTKVFTAGGTPTGGTDPANAFDGSRATNVTNAASTLTLTYQLASSATKVPNKYWMIAPSGDDAQDMATGWTFSGSNDGSTWVTLDTQEGETGWAANEKRFYEFQNQAAFEYIRFEFFGGGGADGAPTAVAEIGVNEDGDTMTAFNLTASSTAGINDGQGFLASDVGRMIRILGGDGKWRWLRIDAHSSSTVVTVRMYGHALPDTRPILNWQLGSWSGVSGGNGFPACVGFFNGRLCFARTAAQPQTVWMSVVDDFTNFGVSDPLEDDDAISATVSSDSINVINWIAEGTDLFLGTTAAIRTIGATSASAAFSPTNIRQKRETNFGASEVQPVRVGTTALYAGYYRRDIREIAYSFDANGYVSTDLSILAEHVGLPGIKQLAYAQNPDSVVWVVRDDNTLVGMTYERDQEVIAFHRHILGGTYDAGGSVGFIPARVDSVATIPGTEGDETWLVVRRTINGSTERYIERLSVGLSDNPVVTITKADATFLDSYLSYSGSSTTTITGLSHLNGQSVYVWSGTKQGPYTVSGGSITIGTAITAGIVGLAYTSTLETLSPEAAARGGTAQSRLGRISEVFVRVNRSMGGTIGPADGTQETLDYTASTDTEGDYGTGTDLYTGDVRVPISMAWERQKRLKLVHSDPSPFHVLGLITEIKVSG